jgi:hypothetical protein
MQTLRIVIALAVVIPCGVVYGLWTDRWVVSDEPGASAAKLAGLPLTVGEWEGEAMAVDTRGRAMAGVAGHLARRYRNRLNGGAVSVLLVCGRPGPVAVHTPDVCYDGAGYDLAAPPARFAVSSDPALPPAEFWVADFLRVESAVPTRLRIFWAWSADGAWNAPDNPRLAFARFPALYKLYVLREAAVAGERPEDEPCTEFLRRLLPELAKCLFPGP